MSDRHAITRVRHEAGRRMLTVRAVERLTPMMVRVTLGGEDLKGFQSVGFDDHVKLFFPRPGEVEPVTPTMGPNGPSYPEGVVPSPMRDFTPRRYDASSNTLAVDFALHEEGPAAEWARRAKAGDKLAVGGPRGSFLVADDFDWYLLAGDESALPAIGRRLEELRSGVTAFVVVTVAGPEEELAFESEATLAVTWVHRPLSEAIDPAALTDAIAALSLPEGDGYAWIAGESLTAKAVRQHLVDRGLNKAWIKAAGYWRKGAAAVHDKHDD